MGLEGCRLITKQANNNNAKEKYSLLNSIATKEPTS